MRVDVRFFKFHFLRLTGFTLLTASSFGNPQDNQSSALLAQAYELTAKGDLESAEAAYQQMIQVDPQQGYPAMVRFLHRTGQTTATQEVLQSPSLAAQPSITRARSYVNAQMQREAIDLLRSASHDSTGTVYQRTLLLSNQLETLGEKDSAAKEIEKALWAPELKDNDRRDLFARLVQLGGPDHLSKVLPLMIDTVVSSSSITYPHARSMALDGLMALSLGPGYAEFHSTLESTSKNSASRAWLFALSSIRKGDEVRAYETLDSMSKQTNLSPRERTFLLEELATQVALDTSRAISIYEELLPLTDSPERVRLYLAQQHFRSDDYAKSVEILRDLNFDKLDDADQQTALNLYLTSLGVTGPMTDLVTEFQRLTKDLPYTKVRDLSTAPFLRFLPANEEGLQAELEKANANNESPNLFILEMAYQNHLGDQDGVAKALQKYVVSDPTNINAVEELADVLSSNAWNLIANNPQTSPPLSQLEKAANDASKALWDVIKLRPYAPDPYNKLISLYNLYEQPDKAREVPRYLADRPNATPDEIHLAAYIYATQGFPELSIPLYEKALSLQQDPRYRLNYAAALGRVGRVDDALEIYRDVIKNGVNGKQYHVHEVHLSALKLAEHHGKEREHVDFLLSLLDDPSVPDRKEFLLEEGKVLVAGHFYEEALKFFQKYQEEFPEDRREATDSIVSTHAEMKDFETARRILNDEMIRATTAEDLAFFRNNYALTFQLEGNVERAVMEWQKLAEELPSDHTAARGLLNAARALVEAGRPTQGRQLYEKYITMNVGDIYGEQLAREEIRRLDRMDIPASTLVDSAILEYGPDTNNSPE